MKRVFKRVIASILISASALTIVPQIIPEINFVAVAGAVNSSSAECDGLVTKSGNNYYYVNGEPIKSKTKKIDGKIYLFGKDGKMLKGGLFTVKKKKYYCNKDGTVECNGWLKINKKDTYYYANSTGIVDVYSLVSDTAGGDKVLYKNGVICTLEDINKKVADAINDSYDGIVEISINKRLFWLRKDNYYVGYKKYPRLEVSERKFFSNNVYDLATGKVVYEFVRFGTNKSYDKKTNMIYTFDDNGKIKSKAKAKQDFYVTYSSYSINYVHGCEPIITCFNRSDKTIKYIYYKVAFKNAVDDYVKDEIGGKKYAELRVTGPVSPMKLFFSEWGAVFYNSTISTMVIESATVEYMDGTIKEYTGSKLIP